MVTHQKNIDPLNFEYIQYGIKTISVEPKSAKNNIQTGEKILYVNSHDFQRKVIVTVTGVKSFSSFIDLLINNNITSIFPNVCTVEQALDRLEKYYPKVATKQDVIAIYFEL